MSAITWQSSPTDPFEVLSLYEMDLVMKNLPPTEILNLSTVSRQWFERTARMESLLERINKVIKCAGVKDVFNHTKCDQGLDPDSRRPLTEIRRVYHSLKVSRCCDLETSANQIVEASDALDWTQMEFSECYFQLMSAISECIANASDTLETLIIDQVRVYKTGNHLSWAKMPQLKVLKIIKSSEKLLEYIFEDVRNLKELTVDINVVSPAAMSDLINILRHNESLERLFLSNLVTEWVIARFGAFTWSRFLFKLKELRIGFTTHEEYKLRSEARTKFLELHRETLTSIVFTSPVGGELMKQIFSFPALTHLTLKTGTYRHEDFKIVTSQSLQHLSILEVKQLEVMKTFLSSAPNLRSLEIFRMENFMVDLIKKLQHLSCRKCDLSTRIVMEENIFPELQSLDAAMYNWRLAHDINGLRHVLWNTTNFQKLYAALRFKKSLLKPPPKKTRSRKSYNSLGYKKNLESGSN